MLVTVWSPLFGDFVGVIGIILQEVNNSLEEFSNQMVQNIPKCVQCVCVRACACVCVYH